MLRRALVSLGAIASLTAVAGAAPIVLPAAIPNGNFQSGDLTNWVVGGGAKVTGAALTVVADAGPAGAGDYAVHATNIGDYNAAFYLQGVFDEWGAIEGADATTYNITFDVKAGNPTANSEAVVRIGKGYWGPTQDTHITQNGALLSDGQWHTVTIPYTTGSGSPDNRFGITVFGWSGSAGYDFYFDNFAVNPVPEPAAMGLIGVVGVGLLHRRRHTA